MHTLIRVLKYYISTYHSYIMTDQCIQYFCHYSQHHSVSLLHKVTNKHSSWSLLNVINSLKVELEDIMELFFYNSHMAHRQNSPVNTLIDYRKLFYTWWWIILCWNSCNSTTFWYHLQIKMAIKKLIGRNKHYYTTNPNIPHWVLY